MIKSYIFGDSSLAKLLAYYLSLTGRCVSGFVLNEQYIKNKNSDKYALPLCSIEDVVKTYGRNNIEVYVAIGYSHMNKDREIVFNWLRKKQIKICSFIHPTAIVSKNVLLGEGNIILENCVIQPFVNMGDGNIIWNNSSIGHETQVGSYNHISAGTTIAGRVQIKNRCFIGINSAIKNDVMIGNNVLISAGSFISHSMVDNAAYVPVKGKMLTDAAECLGGFL